MSVKVPSLKNQHRWQYRWQHTSKGNKSTGTADLHKMRVDVKFD